MIRFLIASCLVLWLGTRVFGGIDSLEGGDEGLWDEGGHSLIVARVRSVEALPSKVGPTHRAVLEPLATLAGHLDPSAQSTIVVLLYAQAMGTSVHAAPEKGDWILAVIWAAATDGDERQKSLYIESAFCRFMPKDAAVVVIRGLDDSIVKETLTRIQTSRLKAKAPTSAPATQASE